MRLKAAVLASLLLAPAQSAQAQTVQDVLTRFDLIGKWADNCNATASDSNWYAVYAATPNGQVTRSFFNGKSKPYNRYVIDRAKITGTEISYHMVEADARQLQFDIVLRKDGERIRVWSSHQQDGAFVVRDGKSTSSGEENNWQTRCR